MHKQRKEAHLACAADIGVGNPQETAASVSPKVLLSHCISRALQA